MFHGSEQLLIKLFTFKISRPHSAKTFSCRMPSVFSLNTSVFSRNLDRDSWHLPDSLLWISWSLITLSIGKVTNTNLPSQFYYFFDWANFQDQHFGAAIHEGKFYIKNCMKSDVDKIFWTLRYIQDIDLWPLITEANTLRFRLIFLLIPELGSTFKCKSPRCRVYAI